VALAIDTIILSARLTDQIPAPGRNPGRLLKSAADGDEPNSEIYKVALRRALSEMSELGKRIIVVLDVPSLGFDPSSCVRARAIDVFKTLREPCRVDRASVMYAQGPSIELTESIASEFPGVEIWNPRDALCDKSWCYAIKDGEVLYRDPDHLSVEGSKYVWRIISNDKRQDLAQRQRRP
jgi:hypothetical protein